MRSPLLRLHGRKKPRLHQRRRTDAAGGPNDVIALDCLGIAAVGVCSNTVTDEQADKLTRWANELADGLVTLMLDCDPEGENGAKQAIWKLARRSWVRLGLSSKMFGGKFRGRQPESLTSDEWSVIAEAC